MKDRGKILDGFRHCMPETEEDGKLSCDTCPYYRCYDSVQLSVELVEDIRSLLKEQPEIVRCRDCKRFDDGICEMYGFRREYDYYCADGVKRDEQTTV